MGGQGHTLAALHQGKYTYRIGEWVDPQGQSGRVGEVLSVPGFEGQHLIVGTATRYGLGGPGIKCRCGRDFPHPSRPALGPTQPPLQWVTRLFPGDKAAEAWR